MVLYTYIYLYVFSTLEDWKKLTTPSPVRTNQEIITFSDEAQ